MIHEFTVRVTTESHPDEYDNDYVSEAVADGLYLMLEDFANEVTFQTPSGGKLGLAIEDIIVEETPRSRLA